MPYGYGPPAQPQSPKVFGILSICFGGAGALFAGFMGMVGLIATSQSGARQGPEDAPLISMFLLIALWSALLVAVGIGQVRYRHWSLSATWVWCVSAVVVAAACAVGFVVALPQRNTGAGFAMMTLMLVPYPVLMMIFFARPAVKESLQD